jgi:predicted ATPase
LGSSDRRRDRDPFGVEYLQFLEHPALVEQVNEYLARLAIPYELVVRHFRAEANNPMQPVRMGSLWLRPTGSSVTVGLDDVGYGVSQVLPQLLALAGDSKLGLIEQPELHLHPRLQADLADLFIATTIGRERQLLVETHSESLLLRLQRRIREGSLDPAAIRILYVLPIRDGSQSDVIQIQLAADGSFMSEWPHGFFEERFVELFGA